VIVRINDRGPFVAGRVIDLSPAAARKLHMTKQGVAKVRLETVAAWMAE
jgi:rare lipoprotein A